MKVIVYSNSDVIRTRIVKVLAHIPEINAFSLTSSLFSYTFSLPQMNDCLMILDLDHISKDIFEKIKSIREAQADSTFIFLMDLSNKMIHNECMKLDPNFCLDKSIDFDKLPEIVESRVGQRSI